MGKIVTNQIADYLLVKITSEIFCYFARKKTQPITISM
jgi:hypothetical protein